MTVETPDTTTELPDEPSRVELILSLEPPTQRRWSIAVRWLLAFPHLFVLEFVGTVAYIGAIGGWFAALFTGRLPKGLQRFYVGYLRYFANVIAYSTLLINKWPTINFGLQPDTLVDVDINQVRLNRLAVLFRIILFIPAAVISILFGFGLYLLLFIMWLIGIFKGRVPRSMHQAVATALRYQLRLVAYVLLVTPRQPFEGMFGEVADDGEGTELEDAPSSPDDGRWRIVKSARQLLYVVMVLSVIGTVLYGVFVPPDFNHPNDQALFMTVGTSYNATVTELNVVIASFSTCATAACISTAVEGAGDQHLYQATEALESAAPYPSVIAADMNTYITNLVGVQKDINNIATATTITAQKSIVTSTLELDVGNLTYRGISILIYLGDQPINYFMG